MPTVYPIKWQPIVASGYYPNLMRRDVAVWERWIAAHGAGFDAVAYDVAVGGVKPADPDLDAKSIAGWKYSTALKIDVLLREHGAVWPVEIKTSTSVSAIGAAVSYQLVLAREEPDLLIAGGGIICETLQADIEWIAAQLKLRTWIV